MNLTLLDSDILWAYLLVLTKLQYRERVPPLAPQVATQAPPAAPLVRLHLGLLADLVLDLEVD